MNNRHKMLTYGVFTASLLAAPAAWPDNGCATQECGELLAQVELLKTQVNASHSDIKKLETALNFVRQDIDALQSGNVKKAGLIASASQPQRTGRGNRNRSAYPN